MVTEVDSSKTSVTRKLEQYVRRILDLSQGNKAIYFATSQNESSDWEIKTKAFKLSNNALHGILENEQVTLLRFSAIQNEVKESRIDFGGSDWREVERGLRKLYSRNREFIKDYGISICYLVYGFLVWQESPVSGKGIWVKSPLLVAEADLERKMDRRRGHVVYRLSLTSPFRLNESLVEALRFQYDLDLAQELEAEDREAGPVELEELGQLEDVVRSIERLASEMGWRVEREAWVAGLYFGNVGIYHDAKKLLESGKLAESPIIRAICLEEWKPSLPHPQPPGEREIDLLETPLPADRSQCEVLWYAEKGSNLVVHGPPGTGKSQTITNLIARAIKQGKRVLFVAERREAIDVVYDRLKELGLTLPVLRVFTLTRSERDRVLDDLYNTLESSMGGYLKSSYSRPHAFPEREYDHEQRYFRLLTETVDSRNLYAAIGETVLKEEELEKWGLVDLADKYHGRQVWKYYGKIDEVTLQTYWDKVVELFKLPLTPTRNGLRVIPLMVSFLEEVEKRFGDISHREVVALIELTRGLHDILRRPDTSQVLEFYVGFDEEKRRELHNIAHQLRFNLERLHEIRAELNRLPSEDDISKAEKALLPYRSWWRRTFSSDYKKLRVELEEGLGLSRKLSHNQALECLTNLRYRRFRLEERETTIIETIEKYVQQVKGESYASIILPANVERLKMILSVFKRFSELRKSSRTRDGIKFLERDLGFLKDFADRTSTEELDSMIELLERIPESGGVRILLNSLHKIQKVVEDVSSIGLDTVVDLVEQIDRFPPLRQLISDVPKGTSFQQFKSLIDFLRFREVCESVLKSFKKWMDYKVVKNCMKRVREFYAKNGQLIAKKWLDEWMENISKKINLELEPVVEPFYDYPSLHSRKRRTVTRLAGFYLWLRRERNKKRKKVGLRELFSRYLPQILEVKPILMMSPATVSALLPRDFLEPIFDLVVFDEASQMKVEMALPSIARGKQLITIGDEKQMPPSRYFERLAFFAEEEEEEEELPESLLQACLNAKGFFKELWLEWYYRGSHESLIAFSNRHFYRDRLIVLPSPNPSDSRVEFVYVNCPSHPNGGCYIEGRGINPCEARAVVRKLLEELSKLENDNFTIGIVAMNDRQQDIIEDLLHRICQESDLNRVKELLGLSGVSLDMFSEEGERSQPLEVSEELIERLEAMMNADRIWVRNLESVQGKEADIVILSMTYGKGRDGKLRQQFGPINREGGERRINVLISRARERMIVVSSMRHTDLRVGEGTPEGVRVLRDFLRYAEEGGRLIGEKEGGWFESPFEESVYYCLLDALSDLGVEIVPQVGVGKYRIDLAIKKDGRYLLGIECDGALYHKHKAARERDRIRDECLRRMGWDIYRIWSTAWFERPLREQIVEEIRELVMEKLNTTSSTPVKSHA